MNIIFNILYDWSLFLGKEYYTEVKRLVIENCSSLYSPTPVMGEKTTRGIFRVWGFISDKGSGVANCNGFYVFSSF